MECGMTQGFKKMAIFGDTNGITKIRIPVDPVINNNRDMISVLQKTNQRMGIIEENICRSTNRIHEMDVYEMYIYVYIRLYIYIYIHIQCVYLSNYRIYRYDGYNIFGSKDKLYGHNGTHICIYIYTPGSRDNHIQPHRSIHCPRNPQLLNVVLGSAEHHEQK